MQLFDSWVGCLAPRDYRSFVLPHMRARHRRASRRALPVIHFGTGTSGLLETMREAGGDVIGVDWRIDLGDGVATRRPRRRRPGQPRPGGALRARRVEIRRRAQAILERARGRPGHIFNLGHGMLPETPVDHVRLLIDSVHEMSAKRDA